MNAYLSMKKYELDRIRKAFLSKATLNLDQAVTNC